MTHDAARLRQMLTGLAEDHRVPGLQFSLYRDGEATDISLGRDCIESGDPVSVSTVFAFGSITKVFIATIVMQLVSAGDIQIDEPLGKYVGELDVSSALGGRVTMRQLLSHSGGLPADLDMGDASSRPLPLLARKCRDTPLIYEPGKFFSYSNVGYSLAARAVEVAVGMPWHEAVECFLLKPLGIEAAFCTEARFRLGPGAAIKGHVFSQPCTSLVPIDVYCPASAAPGGGLCGSASDVARLGQMLSGALAGSTALLDTAARTAMFTQAHDCEPIGMADGWGLGLAKYDHDGSGYWFGHNGSICGTTCNLRFDPDARVVLALATNSVTGIKLWRQLVLELRQEGLSVGDYQPDHGPVVSDGCELGVGWDGEYVNGSLRYAIRTDENGLSWLIAPGEAPARIALREDMVFTAGVNSHRLAGRFIPSAEGYKGRLLAVNGYLFVRAHPGTGPACIEA